jgi:hypothetical protein
MIRKTISCFAIVPTMRRSSFTDLKMRASSACDEIGEHQMGARERTASGRLRSLGTISSSRCQTTRGAQFRLEAARGANSVFSDY